VNEKLYRAGRKRGLSDREAEVLATYVEHDSIAETAHELGITAHTARIHLMHVRTRLNVRHTAAAVAQLV
jgi:DNA-binding CsgD family transcriptional regulator